MLLIRTSLISLLVCVTFSANLFANDLKNHHSPYLAMHGDDPIQWHDWNQKTLEKARQEDKLLYVSIGYFACHWCHVMQQESFKDSEVAKVLNEQYIPVKVDRELNPVLDKRLIEFVQVTNGVAGWPLNVFITPDGYPLAGGTYMPRDHFYGILQTLGERWESKAPVIKSKAKELNQQLSGMLGILELTTQQHSIASQKDLFIQKTMEVADELQGGFGDRKFPNTPQLSALLDINARKPNAEIDEFLTLTLDAITNKGLRDHIGGGFFRYTIDPGWKTPHYEKMLYNNAQLPQLLLKAAKHFKQERYRHAALDSIDFMLTHMRGKQALIASLSAVDESGQEGAYYLFTQQDIRQILKPSEQVLAFAAWDLKRPADYAYGNLPIAHDSLTELADALALTPKALNAQLNAVRQKLLTYRHTQRQVPKDSKQLSGWNGLALSTLAHALPYRQRYYQEGNRLAQFLLSLWDGERLKRDSASDQAGALLDYAAVAKGLLEWAEASEQPRFAAVGAAIVDRAWTLFYDDMAWSESSNSLLAEAVLQSHIPDTPITSPETLLLEASSKLGGKLMNQHIQKVLAVSNRSINADPYAYASLIAFSVTQKTSKP